MVRILRVFLTDQSGATAIEYAIIAGGIATAIIATVYSIGPKLNSTFSWIFNPAEIGRGDATPAVSGRRNRHICRDRCYSVQG